MDETEVKRMKRWKKLNKKTICDEIGDSKEKMEVEK